MRIVVNSTAASVTDATPVERAWLEERVRFDAVPPDAIRRYLFAWNRWPAGIASLVAVEARAQGFAVEYLDARTRPAEPNYAALAGLYPYQHAAASRVLAAGRGVIKAPTGAGKGEIAVALARAVPTRWLYLVNGSHLVSDIAGRWRARGDGSPPVVLGVDGWTPAPRLTLATPAMLWSHRRDTQLLEVLSVFGGLIFDEVHQAAAATFFRTAMGIPAYYRVGLSATPFDRFDARHLPIIGALGPVVASISTEEVASTGAVVVPTAKWVRVRQAAWTRLEEYNDQYRAFIVRSKVRNTEVVRQALLAEKPAMIACSWTEHVEVLEPLLRAAGLRVAAVTGETRDRGSIFASLGAGHLDVIVGTGVVGTGVDIPALRTMIFAAGGKSHIKVIQAGGRAMRSAAGKETALVVDFVDEVERHEGFLRASRVRAQAYSRAGYKQVAP